MPVVIGLLMAFIFADNVVAPSITGEPSLTNRGYDAICEAAFDTERTASGDCISTK